MNIILGSFNEAELSLVDSGLSAIRSGLSANLVSFFIVICQRIWSLINPGLSITLVYLWTWSISESGSWFVSDSGVSLTLVCQWPRAFSDSGIPGLSVNLVCQWLCFASDSLVSLLPWSVNYSCLSETLWSLFYSDLVSLWTWSVRDSGLYL